MKDFCNTQTSRNKNRGNTSNVTNTSRTLEITNCYKVLQRFVARRKHGQNSQGTVTKVLQNCYNTVTKYDF